MSYEIEKGVPLAAKRAYDHKYPFSSMEIGDSFFAPCDETARNRITTSVSYASKRYGTKYVTRKVDGGFRVWRIA